MSEGRAEYQPEPYWSEVAKKIADRGTGDNVIAGDDEPYYWYKRRCFLKMLQELQLEGKSVLEVGCGPGGNLLEILKQAPKRLEAVDISSDMIALAQQKVGTDVAITKVSGTQLPFVDNSFDVVLTVTVLQHNTDHTMLEALLREIGRVAKQQVVLFERVEDPLKGDALCEGRPFSFYHKLLGSRDYSLTHKSFLDVRVSYMACGVIRKLFNPSSRKEGDPLTVLSIRLQKIALLFTKPLDKIFKAKRDLAKMVFVKN